MPVTIKDIAEKVGVSNQAVSAVLNNRTNCRVSPQRRKDILRFAEELGYSSSISAQVMRGKSTKTVAILISAPYMQMDEHLEKLILGLLHQFNRLGYGCLYALSEQTVMENRKIVRSLISRGASTFVFIGEPFGSDELELLFQKNHCSYIFYGTARLKRCVSNAFDRPIRQIIDFFRTNGADDFRVLIQSEFRRQSFAAALPELSMQELETRHLRFFEYSLQWNRRPEELIEVGYDETRKLLHHEPNIRAIFYQSDLFALGGVQYLHKTGRIIGQDVLVAGFNNIMAVRTHLFPISSIEHDLTRSIQFITEEVENHTPCALNIPAIAHIRSPENFIESHNT